MGENGAGGGKTMAVGAEKPEKSAGELSGSYDRGGKRVFIREISNFSIRVIALLLAL